MSKKTFNSQEWLHLTEVAHAAVLSGLLAAKRWEPGEVKFQGGTSLHLIYGSPRFSEDLDFITASDRGLFNAMQGSLAYVRAALARQFPQITVSLKSRDDGSEERPRNPRLYTLSLSEPDWYQTLKVKVEFYVADAQAVIRYGSQLRQVIAIPSDLRVDIAPTKVTTADLVEILSDKIHALGDRARIKERDVFDLWWICNQQGLNAGQAAAEFFKRIDYHLAMYPGGSNLPELADNLLARGKELSAIAGDDALLKDMVQAIARWLPSNRGEPSVYCSKTVIRDMVNHSAACAYETARLIHSGHVYGPHDRLEERLEEDRRKKQAEDDDDPDDELVEARGYDLPR